MIIRRETPAEFSQIYDLVKVAFQTAKVTNSKEQDFVNQLRSSGNKSQTLLLAPISVALEYRNIGVGSNLMKESFKLAKEMGYTSVLLVGDPAYYHRFGFKAAANFGIKHTQNIPDENVMACELVPGALCGISGTAECC